METLKLTGNKTTISFENLKSFIFEDINTHEEFKVKCYPYEVHNLQNTNEDFREWVNGRIIKDHEL
jgi:hypothetical protein